ncbi:MAG: N-acetyltransferase family protein, partial [Desulfococcaceae bacterium]
QRQYASVDYKRNMSLIGLVQRRRHQEIVAIGSYAEGDDDRAEVAFVVREDYQGQGVASYLLERMEIIALENGYKGFIASVLRENQAMTHVFKKRYPNARVISNSSDVIIYMDFDDPEKAKAKAREPEV